MEAILRYPNATTRPMLLSQIQDALKNRQHIELAGYSMEVGKLLDELITFTGGKALIPARHPEDYSIQILTNISFPASDKMSLEHLKRQVLQGFGWPTNSQSVLVTFYFEQLLKILNYDRIIPAFLFENPEVLKKKAYHLLQLLSEFTIDRKAVGIPTIICSNRLLDNPLSRTSFIVELEGGLTDGEIRGVIEEVCPGHGTAFDSTVLTHLHGYHSKEEMKVRIKELLIYKERLGVHSIDMNVVEQFISDRIKKRGYAKTND